MSKSLKNKTVIVWDATAESKFIPKGAHIFDAQLKK